MSEKIPIAIDVLKWARETAGYSLEQVAKNKSFSHLSDWENGVACPTYFQLEALAKKYKRPTALFFFPIPPKEEPIEKSLRTSPEVDINHLNTEIHFLFRKGKAFQIYLKELFSDNTQEQAIKLKWLEQNVHQSSEQLAHQVRNAFDITVEMQHSWKDTNQAFEEWRNLLAQHGVYVFKAAFKDNSVSGFCIYDALFPIIYLNNSQTKNRQIFTLFHELGHLLFKENYLDVLNENMLDLDRPEDSDIEVKCNAFANHFLVPDSDFQNKLPINIDEKGAIQLLADTYKVSQGVILRKLFNHRVIEKIDYERKVKELQKQFLSYSEKKKKAKGGGNFFYNRLAYLGDFYASLIFERYYQGKINQNRASEYLDIKAKSFSGLEEAYFRKEVSHVRI